jgi:DNA processing protein
MAALLVLLRTRARDSSWGSVAAEVADSGSASALLDMDDGGLFQAADSAAALAEAKDEVARWRTAGLTWLTVLDDHYPQRLLDIREAPPFLFYEGGLLPYDRGMSVVGSRSASDWGRGFAADTARLLVDMNLSVLSGLAEGIDAAAHRAALDADGRTVAFLGTGIERSYPASNRDLQSEIARRGLLLSQFYPRAAPTKHTFPMRNATMSGYGLATIVVEAGEFSGARIQARLAGEHGRPVILTSRVARGTKWGAEMSLKPNVRVVASLGELADSVAELGELPRRLELALAAVSG